MSILILQRLLLEAFLDLFYFPVWWYTKGIKYAGNNFLELLKAGNNFLTPGLWIKNLFVPMYGQFDWEGRIVSFIIRFIQIVVRLFALLLWLFFSWIIFLCWFIIPIIVVYGLYFSLN